MSDDRIQHQTVMLMFLWLLHIVALCWNSARIFASLLCCHCGCSACCIGPCCSCCCCWCCCCCSYWWCCCWCEYIDCQSLPQKLAGWSYPQDSWLHPQDCWLLPPRGMTDCPFHVLSHELPIINNVLRTSSRDLYLPYFGNPSCWFSALLNYHSPLQRLWTVHLPQ